MVIQWTDTATRENNNNLLYLLDKWGHSVCQNYLEQLERAINRIQDNPHIGQYDEEYKAHKYLVVRQIYLFYTIENNTLIILSIWNNYRKPIWK